VSRDSSVGIVTRYGLDAPGIDSWWSDIFAPVQTCPGANAPSYTGVIGPFLAVKRAGRGVDHPLHLAPRLKKEYNYTSAPPLGLRGLFIYLLIRCCYITRNIMTKVTKAALLHPQPNYSFFYVFIISPTVIQSSI
jgi:hypothetical protein